jgi:hypothetical protein
MTDFERSGAAQTVRDAISNGSLAGSEQTAAEEPASGGFGAVIGILIALIVGFLSVFLSSKQESNGADGSGF